MRVVSLSSRRFRFAAPLGLLSCVFSTWLLSGCGSDVHTSICEAQCTCANQCNDATTEACSKTLEANMAQAATRGCNANGEADAYLKCESERATCVGGSYSNTDCVAQTQVFFSCLARVGCSFAFSEHRVVCET